MNKKGFIVLVILSVTFIFTSVLSYHVMVGNENKLYKLINNTDYKIYKNNIIDKINEIYDKYKDKKISSIKELNILKSKLDNEYNEEVKREEELNSKVESLSKQRDSLKNNYNKLLEEKRRREALEIQKSRFIIKGAPTINQYSVGYPTGCESAALTLLLRYWGVNVSMSSIVNSLPKGPLPYYEGNTKYGGNPYVEFVGHPSTSSSYGTYDKVIEGVANKYKSGIINGRGMPFSSVLSIVRSGRPVIVWNTIGLLVPYISDSWIYKPTGEKINWMAQEHALLVIGYDNNNVIVSDSLTGTYRYFDRYIFENRYNAMGKRVLYY